eukprot:TRINITY_DN12146_c0_g1_i1.p1 TRINITY_DN12146_c0_g1~~TRINITY_DN12146_c0_g1_i1.p1  ORF type:complete len:672 (+),score=120.37 TRINITY_DN12146_c0_g1_i1:110-2125(+)
MQVHAADFSVYPGSTTNLAVQGTVAMTSTAGVQDMTFDFKGVDPRCNTSAVVTAANGCGIHIHAGNTCAAAGGHFYDKTAIAADPWAAVRYTAVGDETSGTNMEVRSGTDDIANRTFVVHDFTGARISCSPLLAGPLEPTRPEASTPTAPAPAPVPEAVPAPAPAVAPVVAPAATPGYTMAVQNFEVYPGSATDLRVAGSVRVDTQADSQIVSYSLDGVDPRCNSTNVTAKNGCGLHIHAGTSCESAGGHYWNSNVSAVDVWAPVRYHSVGSRAAGTGLVVPTGFTQLQIQGHAFVVHDFTGARVACSLVTPHALEASTGPGKKKADKDATLVAKEFSVYPGANTTLESVAGEVELKDAKGWSGAQAMTYSLTGIDPRCVGPSPFKNGCGIHVHEGTDCAAALGHFWDPQIVAFDPWAKVSYTALPMVDSPADAKDVIVTTGVALSAMEKRTFVVHDFEGKRIACSTLKVEEEQSSLSPMLIGGAALAVVVGCIAMIAICISQKMKGSKPKRTRGVAVATNKYQRIANHAGDPEAAVNKDAPAPPPLQPPQNQAHPSQPSQYPQQPQQPQRVMQPMAPQPTYQQPMPVYQQPTYQQPPVVAQYAHAIPVAQPVAAGPQYATAAAPPSFAPAMVQGPPSFSMPPGRLVPPSVAMPPGRAPAAAPALGSAYAR